MPDFIELVPSGGTAVITAGAQTSGSNHLSRASIYQVVGLVPMDDCDKEDCRIPDEPVCDTIPVFGHIVDSVPVDEPTYENDFSAFLISIPAQTSGQLPGINFVIEKAKSPFLSQDDDFEWEVKAIIQDDTYGGYFPLKSIPAHDFYTGVDINWAIVVNTFGPGWYRIKCNIIKYTIKVVFIDGIPVRTPIAIVEKCLSSKIFDAQEWDCNAADGTVKFETSLTGSVGSIDEYEVVYNLCGFKWYDSLRIRGFFGEETTPKYEELINEFQTGRLELIHNKLVNRFKFKSYWLPKWAHDRLKAYMMMADTILVSDYNYNNSDYDIKRKGVRPAGNYEPEYLDTKYFTRSHIHFQRRSKVKVDFRESSESVIKSLCCPCP
jgi:hypothetical protein